MEDGKIKLSDKIVIVSVDDLRPSEYNPRIASDKQWTDLKNSIARFGMVDPLIVNAAENRKNIVIGGHFRLKVAQEMGIREVPVVYVSIPDIEKEQELNLRLNKNMGEFNIDQLAEFDEEMLLSVGFEPQELDDIFGGESKSGKSPDAIPPTPEEPKSQLGELYILGQHRVMCGDTCDPAHVKTLMQEDLADLVFTDPPYNVDYKGKGANTSQGIRNDALPEAEFEAFINKAFLNMHAVMKEGAVFYICSGWSSYPVFYRNLIAMGFYRAGVIIWVKNNASYGWNDFRYKHEWILVGKKKRDMQTAVSIMYGWKKGSHFFRDTRDEYDVWQVPRKNAGSYEHPTEKPVWLVEKALVNSSERYQIVADLFGGSGSTLIACERLRRRCLTMERDPHYVDVIIRRWEEYTGQQAEKVKVGAEGATAVSTEESMRTDQNRPSPA